MYSTRVAQSQKLQKFENFDIFEKFSFWTPFTFRIKGSYTLVDCLQLEANLHFQLFSLKILLYNYSRFVIGPNRSFDDKSQNRKWLKV